jgi:hypothetical protein
MVSNRWSRPSRQPQLDGQGRVKNKTVATAKSLGQCSSLNEYTPNEATSTIGELIIGSARQPKYFDTKQIRC